MKPEVLVKAFVLHQSEDGFCELVASTMDDVYSRAQRIVQGPPHLVEETVLRVYWELARKASRLHQDVVLAIWLREHTCKTAVRVLHGEQRSVDRATLKNERRGLATPTVIPAAPPGLATRVSQSILLNIARNKASLLFLPRVSWPAWIRAMQLGAAAACVLGLIALWNMPFHRRNPIIESPELQLTPASFGQLASSEEGGVPLTPSQTLNTNAQVNRNQQ